MNAPLRMDKATQRLVDAAKVLLATNPAFRIKPIGGEGSPARLEQQDKIEAEDALRAAIFDIERVM